MALKIGFTFKTVLVAHESFRSDAPNHWEGFGIFSTHSDNVDGSAGHICFDVDESACQVLLPVVLLKVSILFVDQPIVRPPDRS